MGSYELINFPLTGAMDSKSEDIAIPTPSLALAYNVHIPKTGGYARRRPYTTMTASTQDAATVTGQRAIYPYRDTVLMLDATKAYEYSTTESRWVDKGTVPIVQTTIQGVAAPADTTPIFCDMGVCTNGVSVHVSLDVDSAGANGSLNLRAMDANGTFLGSRVLDAAPVSQQVRCAATGNRVWVVWAAAANVLKTLVFDATSSTTINSSLVTTSPVTSASDINSISDITPRPVAGNVFVAYLTTTAGLIKWGFLDTAGALGSTSTFATGVTPTSITCAVQSSEALHGIAYADTTNPNDIYAIHRTWNGSAWSVTASSGALDTAMTAGGNFAIACIYTDATTLTVFYSEVDTTNSVMRTYQSTYTSAGVATSRTKTLRHVWLASKPQFFNSVLYFVGYCCGTESAVTPYSVDNPTFYLFRATDGIPLAVVTPGTSFTQFFSLGIVSLSAYSAGLRFASLDMLRVFNLGGSLLGGIAIRDVFINFSPSESLRSWEWDLARYMPSGFLLEYDGVSFVESGFLRYVTPNARSWSLASSNGAGVLASSKTYYYVALPEWTNAQGRRHLGTHGGSKSITTGVADNTVTVTIKTVVTTLKQGSRSDFAWVIYRTDDAVATENSIFYRVGSIPNDPAADQVVFTDLNNLTVAEQEQIYLGTGELDNSPPPFGHVAACSNGRAAVAGSRSSNSIVNLSKTATSGRALEFSDAITISVPEEGGAITGIEWLNETLFIFKKERIYRVRGTGPNNSGVGSFADPELLTTDCGCITQRSIVAMPMGVMFQAERGIMLITQSHQVVYAGAAVESPPSPGAALGTCIDAVLLPEHQHVRFSDGTTCQVFDYYHQRWMVWSAASDGPSCEFQDVHTMPAPDAIWQQSGTTWQDVGVDYLAKLSLAWVAGPASKLGHIKIRKVALLGSVKAASTLNMSFKYDSLDSTVESHTTTLSSSAPLRFTCYATKTVTNQFRVDLTDLVQPSTYTTTEGMVWTDVTIEVMVKKGLHLR